MRGNIVKEEYFVLYFMLLIGSVILFTSIFFIDKIRKSIMAVVMNLSLVGFVPYLFLIVGIISLHQNDACRNYYEYDSQSSCFVLIDDIGVYLSYILLVLGLIFVYFYAGIIKKWKGSPE